MTWPSNSSHLDNIENIWPILSDYIYDRNNIINLEELETKIKEAISGFNETKKHVVDNLYNSISGRLLSVFIKRGDRQNIKIYDVFYEGVFKNLKHSICKFFVVSIIKSINIIFYSK